MAGRSFRSKNPTKDSNLQDQVRTLASENDRLKAIINEHGLSHLLNTALRIRDEENVGKLATPSPSQETSSAEIRTPGTPKRKGCTCRGNCSTRICGCVKKQIPCGEFCRCANEQCQNQEPDKENLGESKSRRSNKRVENVIKKRGLFSPLSTNARSDLNIQEPMDKSLRFGENSDSESLNKNEDEVFENRAVPGNSENNVAKKLPGRSRRQNLAPVEPQKKLRSASNKEQEEESTTQAKKVRNKRSASVGGSGDGKASNEAHNKTLASLINGKKSLRKTAAAKMSEASSSNYGNIEDQEFNDKKIKEGNKKTKKTEKGKSKKKDNKHEKLVDEEQAEVNELLEEAANNIQLAVQEEMRIEQQNKKKTSDPVENSEAEAEKHSDENTETGVLVKTELQDDFFPPVTITEQNEQSSSNNSPGSESGADNSSPIHGSAKDNHLLQIDDPNFDPMKPRHNLSRSPIGPCNEPRTYPTLDVSEKPLAPPLEEAAEELPPPDELNCIIVDWDKHQKERVYCTKCQRGFYPYRIKKHEASCKKV